jgi:DNA polymerase III subunit delta'
MTTPTPSLQLLSTQLCPWLRPAFESLSSAHRSARLGHAWLIAGPAGIGKINLALALADRLLNGPTAATPGELEPREALAAIAERHAPADHHPDLHWLYPEEDKHSISVEQVRDVIDALALTAHGGAAKVVIVEPADAMTTAAANALLKTLEEPSGDTYLLLLSHQPGRLAATIRSRCQRIDLPRPSIEALRSWLGSGDTAAVADIWGMTGGAPLTAAAIFLGDDYKENKGLLDIIADVCEDRIDSQRAADTWAKADTALALTWLTRQLHGEIRQRLSAGVSTSVTDQTAATLHNAWRNLTLRTLFEQYEKAERLLNQLGSGINLDLALQALLGGFLPNRGRP